MPQPPFLVDQIQIEPGSSGTRLISRHSTGELRFQDPQAILLLSQMAGARNITGVFVVGRGGYGAPYTSIQDALDAVPSASSSASPSVIVVYPGTYAENLAIQKDGVSVIGLGQVTVSNVGAANTITVSSSIASTPKSVTLRNLSVTNNAASKFCVSVLGADTFATGSFVVNAAPLAVGDVIVIGGLTLTGAACGVSGSNNFDATLGTTTALAAAIAAAINDPANAFSGLVQATPVGASVNLTAVAAGSGGNSITLSAATTPAGRITPSGATLTGGTAAGSDVALEGLFIEDCTLQATGTAAGQVSGDTCNNIYIQGGTFLGSASGTEVVAVNCAKVSLSGVAKVFDLDLSYDTGNPQPSVVTSEYIIEGALEAGDILSNLSGVGSLKVLSCPSVGAVGVSGDRTLLVRSSGLGGVTLSDTIGATLVGSTRGLLSVGSGTPTLRETLVSGTKSFVASSSELVFFNIPQPDTSYFVFLDVSTTAVIAAVTARTTSGFTISTSVPYTGSIGFTVIRQIS
jgi:hypothetical protein